MVPRPTLWTSSRPWALSQNALTYLNGPVTLHPVLPQSREKWDILPQRRVGCLTSGYEYRWRIGDRCCILGDTPRAFAALR